MYAAAICKNRARAVGVILMLAYTIRRLLQSIVVMLVVALVAFALFRFVGDPIASMVGQETTLAEREAMPQAQGLNEILTGMPGVAIARSGGVGALSQARIRGAEARHVLVMIDGVDANDPAVGSTVDISHISLAGVNRIELLRGPQSALWGSDALAGVINIETATGLTAPVSRVNVESGSFGTTSIGGEFRTRSDDAWIGVGGTLYGTDGINVSGGGSEGRDGYRNATMHLNTGYDGGRWSIDASLRHTDAEAEYDPTPAPAFVPVDGDREFHTRHRYARLRGTFEATPGWTQTLSVGYFDTDNANFADGERTNRSDARRWRVSLQSDWVFQRHGLDHRATIAIERQTEDFSFRAPAEPWGDPNQDQSIAANSLVVEYDVAVGERLGATLSGRTDRNSDFDDALAGRASVRYEIPEQGTRVFFSVGTGINNPTFTERFGFTPDTFIGNPNLQPERSLGVQIALDQRVSDSLVVDLTWFRDRLVDEIDGFAFDAELGGFTAVNRDGRSRRQGIELGARFAASEQLMLSAAYGYLDATEPSADGQQRELRRPRHTGRIVADAQALGDRLQLQVGAAYVGSRLDQDFATFPATQVRLSSYWLGHMTARYHLNRNWSVFGRVENALDADYQDVFGYHTPGRSGYIGLTATL
jgi:vitamin B12 transporter